MGANWGLFLCNCRQTLSIDPNQLIFPTTPSVFSFASNPEHDIHDFAARAKQGSVDRVLVGCCAAQSLFQEALQEAQPRPPKVHFLSLKESCFAVHADSKQAHAKATRLLRASMKAAEAEAELEYNPLKIGNRILVSLDSLQNMSLVERLQTFAETIVIVNSVDSFQQESFPVPLHVGKVVEISGRLGSFRVVVEASGAQESGRREFRVDQVAMVSYSESAFKPRTGFYTIQDLNEADIEVLVGRVRDHIGDFLKPVHVTYNHDTCAGGSASQEACGVCIPACPYDAISRDKENRLRMRVEHMACEGCGACVSACPTSALQFTTPSPEDLYVRLEALLRPLGQNGGGQPLVILFHCGEQGRRALEAAGTGPIPYPATVLPVEMACLRHVSEANILTAFRLGAAGVALLGCESCPHGERELLYQKLDLCRLVLDAFDLGQERLRLFTADESTLTAAVVGFSRFAESLVPTPIRWDGQPLQQRGNRDVIAGAIAALIQQTGKEPGRRTFEAPYPFAFADVNESGCTMCRSCVNVCPVHAFRLDENTQSLQFKHMACVACGLCEKVCPEHVIALRREIYFDKDALDYQTVVQDSMVSCVKCGKPYINRKALETVEARLFSLESLLDTFSGNRKNLLRMCPDCRAVDAMLEMEKGWKP